MAQSAALPPLPRRVACLSPYPDDGPSLRHRIALYAGLWSEQGVRLDVLAFATRRLYRIRRRFGLRWTAEKAFWMAFGAARLMVRLAGLWRYDVVIIHREAFPLGPPLFEALAARINPRIVFDIDDAIWSPPSNAVNQRRLFWDADRVAKIIRRSREVVVGNAFLASYARRFNPKVTIAPTPFEDLSPAPAPAHGALPVVVWIGNTGNAWYVAERMAALEAAFRLAPFTLRLVGGPDTAQVRSDVVPIDRRPWSPAEELALVEAAVGIMPLPDLDYEKGKSGFKIVQYWSAGAAVVASPVGVNKEMIADGRNGLLAETDAQWAAALTRLLGDEALRRRVAEAGRQTFLGGYTRPHGARIWMAVFSRAMRREAA
jgi:glycosyltransferase involved in cell wall biosynthesis